MRSEERTATKLYIAKYQGDIRPPIYEHRQK